MTDLPRLEGRPVTLAVLDYGLFDVNAGRRIGLQGYLVETDAGERVLIDTGMPPDYVADPAGAARRDGLGSFGRVVALTEENLVHGQLARLGLTVPEIDLLVLTHGHIDHAGGLAAFAGRPILLAAEERAEPRPIYFGDARPLAWPEADYTTIAADTPLGPGFTLLHAPGHSPGTLAALLELPQTGPVLLACDVISRESELFEGFAGAFDPAAAEASARRLLRLAAETGAFLVCGHSPEQWPALRKAPERYT